MKEFLGLKCTIAVHDDMLKQMLVGQLQVYTITLDMTDLLLELGLTHLQHGEAALAILIRIYLNGLKKTEHIVINTIVKILLI